jgi:hypothetical protein
MPIKDEMADLDEWPYIYCDDCRTVQPVVLVQNDEMTADLLCATCTRIMATLHKQQAHDRAS